MFAYYFLRIIVGLFRFVPFSVLYLISDGLAFLLYRVVGYRKKVILDNLHRAFPEKSEAEIRAIVKETYRNLTDVSLETIKTFTTSLEEVHRRCQVLNPEIIAEYLDKGQSVILGGSHNTNWEYTGLTMPVGVQGRLSAAYKPMTNKVISDYVNRKRSRSGVVPIAMDDMFSVMRREKKNKEVWAYMLIADQSPSSRKRAQWVTLFGQETAALPGIDVLARMFDFPVFTYQIRRVRRGDYEIEYAPLCLEPSATTEADITRAYTKRLEEEIRACPGGWLWSHKRWKMRKET